MAQLAIGVVGGIIGGYVGGPVGAQIGFAIGSGIGGLLFPTQGPTIEGPRLRDTAVQTSTDGAPIAEVWGTIRLAGNVIWATQIKETRVEEDVGDGKGGMGGGGATQVSYKYSVSMAVGICEGPITGIRRIWADSKLIYSVAVGATPETFSANTSRGTITFYLGTETQTADPTIAAAEGAANTPAFRGVCYAVFTDFQLADFANHIPNFEFEVVKDGTKSYPNFTNQPSSGLPIPMVVDERRGVGYYTEDHPTTGDAVYKWPFDATDAEEIYYWTAADLLNFFGGLTNDVAGLAIDEDRDELVITGIGGHLPYLRIDLATGAALNAGILAEFSEYSVNGNTDGVLVRTQFYYDRNNRIFWGLGDGFSTGDLFLIHYLPHTGAIGAIVIDESSNSANPRHQTLRDSEGNIWLATAVTLVKAGYIPTGYTLPASINPEKTVMWAARGEIWMVRASSHSTLGWIVFDIATETFTTSEAFFGSPDDGRTYQHGVENERGQMWFGEGDGTGGVRAVLMSASGTVLKTVSPSQVDTNNTNWNNWQYVPGVVIINEDNEVFAFYEDGLAPGTQALSTVVSEICATVSFTNIDVSDLASDIVRGFARTRPMTVRQAIEPLALAYGFDGVESDGVAKFVKRGGASAQTFVSGDLGARANDVDGEPEETFTATTALETELPIEMTITFFNVDTDHLQATARQRRLTGRAQQKLFTELPIGFTSSEGNQVVDNLMRQAWVERTRFAFKVGPEFSNLEPTDIVTLPDESRVRITRTNAEPSGVISFEASGDDQGALTSYAIGNDDDPDEHLTLDSGGATVIAILDVVLLRDIDSDVGQYIAASGESSSWPGAVVYESKDGGVTWTGKTAFVTPSKIGAIVSGYLPRVPKEKQNSLDREGYITVKLTDPSLTLSTPSSWEEFYQGANAFFVSTDSETWELVQGYNVTSNVDGTYTITDFLRGRKGTDSFIKRWGVGARVVFVESSRIAHIDAALADVGSDSLWKGVTSGQSLSDEIARERTFDGVAATPLAPVEIGGGYNYRNGAIDIFWTRRARIDGDWRTGGGGALDEDSEAYEVEIWDDGYGDLKRTITDLTTNSTSYTAAFNSIDFGSPQIPYVAVRVFQISSRIGRGFAGEARVGIVPGEAEFSPIHTNTGWSIRPVPYRNRRIVHSGISTSQWAPLSLEFNTGKWYWEILIEAMNNNATFYFGLSSRLPFNAGGGISTTEFAFRGNGAFAGGAGTGTGLGGGLGTGDLVRIAWDANNGKMWIQVNNEGWLGEADPSTGLGHQASYTVTTAKWRPMIFADTGTTSQQHTCSYRNGNVYAPPDGFTLLS